MRIGARIGAACSLAAACFLGLTGDFGPRDEPMTEGIPPAPRWLQRAAGPYSWFRRTRFVGWHPSRLEMLVETYRPHAGQLHRVPFPGARLRQLTFFQNWVGSATYPPNRDDFLVLSKDRDGDEHYQSYRYDLNTRLTTLLTDGKSRYRNGGVGPRGRPAGLRYHRAGRGAGRALHDQSADPAERPPDCLAAGRKLECGELVAG